MEGIKPPRIPKTYIEKTYREIAPGHLDIHNPIERVVIVPDEKEKAVEEKDANSEPLPPVTIAEKKPEPTPSVATAPKPVKDTLRSEALGATSFYHAYKGGARRGMRVAYGIGFGAGVVMITPFALMGGVMAGMWWATKPLSKWFDKLFAGGKKKGGGDSHGHAKHDDRKKDDHHHGGHGH